METYSPADLITNPDGSIYHLQLLPHEIADTIITVGDPDRVSEVSKYFDRITVKKQKREFHTHSGYIGNQFLTVISTGIGTDNIEIVLNELDALKNFDFAQRNFRDDKKSLNIIRIGTSGALQAEIEMDSILISEFAMGLDSLMNFYPIHYTTGQQTLMNEIKQHFIKNFPSLSPYLTFAGNNLVKVFEKEFRKGFTITAPGFYAPQGRNTRIFPNNKIKSLYQSFDYNGMKFTNLEMETAGIYALSNSFGHNAISVNAILANRELNTFSSHPELIVKKAIEKTLEIISQL